MDYSEFVCFGYFENIFWVEWVGFLFKQIFWILNSIFLNCGQPRKIHKSHKKWVAGLLVQDYSRADYVDWIQVEYYVIALILKIHLSRSKTKIRVHYAPVTNGAQMAFTAFCDATLNCYKNIFFFSVSFTSKGWVFHQLVWSVRWWKRFSKVTENINEY